MQTIFRSCWIYKISQFYCCCYMCCWVLCCLLVVYLCIWDRAHGWSCSSVSLSHSGSGSGHVLNYPPRFPSQSTLSLSTSTTGTAASLSSKSQSQVSSLHLSVINSDTCGIRSSGHQSPDQTISFFWVLKETLKTLAIWIYLDLKVLK